MNTLKINPFSKTYDNRTVLSFPEFLLKKGTIYAVIGANGCGKSTFAKILSGTLAPDSVKKAIRDVQISVGYLPQKPYAFHMSLFKNLMINAAEDKQSAKLRAEKLLSDLSLIHLSDKQAISLSGGETARMALARLMMKDYDLFILDEPCAAMDIPSTLQTETLITEYCKKTGSAFIIITHSLQQAKRIADEVLFFHEGTLMECGPAAQVLSNPKKNETRQFLEFFS